jgi:hypothetical protein
LVWGAVDVWGEVGWGLLVLETMWLLQLMLMLVLMGWQCKVRALNMSALAREAAWSEGNVCSVWVS